MKGEAALNHSSCSTRNPGAMFIQLVAASQHLKILCFDICLWCIQTVQVFLAPLKPQQFMHHAEMPAVPTASVILRYSTIK